ncbi:tellurite resistance TerB family protein [Pelagibacterium halotolerans]|uniref:tellurite resistance TerB family protein n=1 Tax=Pelagibacterium halotolerans TaxID=531813 RepID=UPI00384DC87F
MFDFDKIVTALKTDPNMQRTAGAGAVGLAAGLLLGGGGVGKLAKYGALAAVGGLAYNAWQKSQQNKAPDGDIPPADERFIPQAENEREALGKSLVRAMIAAAKADNRIDADEKERIFQRLETMDLSAEEKAFVFDELAAPLDLNAVVRSADTPEHAAEIYAASLVAITADTATERAYLETLASRLHLPAALVAEIHAAADAETKVS